MDNEEEGSKLIFDLLLNHHLHTRVTLVEASANYFFVILFVNAIGTSIYGFFNAALYSDQADFRFFRYELVIVLLDFASCPWITQD